MRAAVIVDGRLVIEERPDPVPGDGEILIRVRASGINGADLAQRRGNYPAPPGAPPDIPGLECAGETEDGRRVMALLPGGGHAELVTVHESHTLPVPETVGWPAAGGFMEVFATAHDALFTQAQLMPSERLLVNGRVVVPVHATYPLGRAEEAYEAFAAGGKLGKLVLTA